MKPFLILTLALFTTLAAAQEKKICITIDDIPAVTYGRHDLYLEINERLLATFDSFDIPAIGYVTEQQLYRDSILDSTKVQILEMWLQRGYDLGNHTYSHLDYNKVENNAYFMDIVKGESVIRPLMKKYDKKLRYFRHPYLRSGDNAEKDKALRRFLRLKGYKVAPVTIDNDEYLFAKAYHNAIAENDTTLRDKIGQDYIQYMEQKLQFFEGLSIELFDRNITQTLLIHGNLLNAHYLDELAAMYKKNGYTFVSQAEALKDPIYKTAVTVFKKRGHSWIYRWAWSQGKGEEIMEKDIETPPYIISQALK